MSEDERTAYHRVSSDIVSHAMSECYSDAEDGVRDILSNSSSRAHVSSVKEASGRTALMADEPMDLLRDLRCRRLNIVDFPDNEQSISPSFPSALGSDQISTYYHKRSYHSPRETYTENITRQKTYTHGKENGLFQTLNKEVKQGLCEDNSTVLNCHEFVQNASKGCDGVTEKSGDLASMNGTCDSSFEIESPFMLRGPKDTYRLPRNIAKMLYPHQIDGLKWLWSLHCRKRGGILADDMGLGKTIQIGAFLAGLFHSRLIKRALIVVPKTLLFQWFKELSAVGLFELTREYCASLKTSQYELESVLQGKGILLTTYDTVRNNSMFLKQMSSSGDDDGAWDYLILDEGHLIKNPRSQRAQSLLKIRSGHRIIMSGTPIQNNLRELWALFHFCCPGLLGDSFRFIERYENPILNGQNKNAPDIYKHKGSAMAKELRDRIQPYFLRRLKHEVFHESGTTESNKLPKKNDIVIWLKLTGCQRLLYEASLGSIPILSVFVFDGSPLHAITILKKISNHPLLLKNKAARPLLERIVTRSNDQELHMAKQAIHSIFAGATDIKCDHGMSCKATFVLTLLGILIPEGHKVLIFSQSRQMLDIIQKSLVPEGYRFLRIDGTTNASDRVKIVDDFQKGTVAPIFLLTSLVGGFGLNLTNADRVVIVDPAWNPSTDNQCVDRAYRIGQKKDVVVYRLLASGTIEEKIYRRQIFKGGLFKCATEHKEHTRYFDKQDLEDLFSRPLFGYDVSVTQKQLYKEHDCQHTVEKIFDNHIKFLEAHHAVAGVSHHSLLFSRATPLQNAQEENRKAVPIGRTLFSKHHPAHSSCGSECTTNLKNVKLQTIYDRSKTSITTTTLLQNKMLGNFARRLRRLF